MHVLNKSFLQESWKYLLQSMLAVVISLCIVNDDFSYQIIISILMFTVVLATTRRLLKNRLKDLPNGGYE